MVAATALLALATAGSPANADIPTTTAPVPLPKPKPVLKTPGVVVMSAMTGTAFCGQGVSSKITLKNTGGTKVTGELGLGVPSTPVYRNVLQPLAVTPIPVTIGDVVINVSRNATYQGDVPVKVALLMRKVPPNAVPAEQRVAFEIAARAEKTVELQVRHAYDCSYAGRPVVTLRVASGGTLADGTSSAAFHLAPSQATLQGVPYQPSEGETATYNVIINGPNYP